MLGIGVLDIESLPLELVPTARSRYGKKARFVVTAVFDGMAGQDSGLRVGDRLYKWGNVEVESLRIWRANTRARGETSTLTIVRDRREVRVDLRHQLGCGYAPGIYFDDHGNAKANGNQILFSDAYLRQTPNDDLLATTVGHELAHNILGHPRRGKRGDLWRSRRHEREADYYGLYLSAMAGYEPVLSQWSDKLGLTGILAFERGYTHPTDHERTIAIERTVAEIAEKRERGEKLWPRME